MREAIRLLQAIEAVCVDDGASETVQRGRRWALSKLLIDAMGPEEADAFEHEFAHARQRELQDRFGPVPPPVLAHDPVTE